MDSVYKMDEAFNWTKMSQKLRCGRFGHRSVRSYVRTSGHKTITHVGGFGEQNIETWELLDDETFDIKVSNFQIDGWRTYPESFLIQSDQFNC